MLHRDLKPDNIGFKADGTVKVSYLHNFYVLWVIRSLLKRIRHHAAIRFWPG